MLHTHRSASADVLVAELGLLLAEPAGDPFAPEIVAVPARGVERWIAQRLSHVLGAGGRRDGGLSGAGVCANVLFPSPVRLLDDALRAAQAHGAGAGVEGIDGGDPWDPERAVWPLLALIGAGPGGGDARYAAAARLARLFDAYGQERPEMLRRWAAGEDVTDAGGPLPADLAWQPDLWRRLRADLGVPAPAERLPAACKQLEADPAVVDLPARFSVFGLNRLSTARLSVLAALATGREVHLWIQHASPALWDAVESGDGPHHPLLASMSRDVQALQRRLMAAAPGRVDHLHPGPAERPTLLGRLQGSLAADCLPAPGERPDVAPDDRSVTVHACHGRARQVEVLREALLELLAADPSLEPRDILVMCPDVEEFAPLVAAAFGLEAPDASGAALRHPAARLRVRIADRALTQSNPLIATMSALVGLAAGRVTAADVLDLVATAPVRRRFAFADEDTDRLRDWVSAARISWGLDAAHRDRYSLGGIAQGTWRDGLDRVLLGVAMEDGEHWLSSALPLDDVDSTDIDLAGRFAELLDRLDAALGALSRPQPVSAWTDALHDAVLALAAPAAGAPWQAAALANELAEIRASAAGHDVELSPGDVAALLAGRLAGRPTRAGFRTGTLTVSTMVPMRSVPHRVIALLGLDDGTFPRAGVTDGDDLLARPQRRPGERDPRTEDRQLLLDAICAAGDHLVIVHSGADERSGVTVPPAVPLGELLDALDAVAAGADGRIRDQVTIRHPLQPFDPRNFGVGGPAGAAIRRPVSFDVAALAGARAVLAPRTAPRPLVAAALDAVPTADVELTDLVDLLIHPARGFLRQRLDVVAAGWYSEPAVALPVELDDLQKWDVGERILAARLRGLHTSVCLALESRRGTLPPHELGLRAAREIGRRAEAIATLARPDVDAAEPDAVDIDVPLGAGETARRLTGTVTGVRGTTRLRVGYSSLGAKQRLTAWIELLALSAAQPDRRWHAVVVGRAGDSGARRALGPVEADAARETLADLVALRDDGLRAPLPLPLKTGCAYGEARSRNYRHDSALRAAERAWAGSGRYPGEQADAEHRLVWGPDAPLEALGPDRLAELAARVWLPLLAAERTGRS